MSDNKKNIKPGHDYETTGHSWDGIEEYNKPLPKWWLWTFYACIVWGIGYTIAYPAWPGIHSATSGILRFSTRGEVAQEIARVEQANAPINQELANADLVALSQDTGSDLHRYAGNAGAAIFRSWCAQCHGDGAAGNKGYPNLLDDDWLWGGSVEEIYTSVHTGIRQPTDEDYVRTSEMPAFGRDELLDKPQIAAVVNYVMSLSEEPRDPALVEDGAQVFADNCAACHGDDGTGDRTQGAPNLADSIWLYGGDYEAIHETVWNARYGQMPPMGGADLSEAEVRAVVLYVHGLGGGEASE
ncbi:cytochrome-c oxidase, cbb3-type subunit III [Sagittula salina]|uniref:Cbb3-type cytochrome c oxidase subunit n=1 Tax=Sagittula salina TaxID=2820268 RepID=A0A940RZS0_9RHOB|nr:cytochrome-c oxidase, cbb3-type subunit III [Sagittula salina]MBP0481416.1 cytochrome-c oxidase, cbb3-type subunit III [Sagittula salina]